MDADKIHCKWCNTEVNLENQHDGVAYWVKNRARCSKCKAQQDIAYARNRYQTDAEFRENELRRNAEAAADRYTNDPAHRKHESELTMKSRRKAAATYTPNAEPLDGNLWISLEEAATILTAGHPTKGTLADIRTLIRNGLLESRDDPTVKAIRARVRVKKATINLIIGKR
jgi:hypothetical protein